MRIIALLLLLAAIVAGLIWCAWKIRPWVAWVSALAIIGACAWVTWKFQPWMPPGQAVIVSTQHLGDLEFQVWQRKNPQTFEPFATGLFVRERNGPWRAYLLDFEDMYRPSIVLRKESVGISVVRDGERLGVFNQVTQTYTQESTGYSCPGAVIDGEPPGNWWLK